MMRITTWRIDMRSRRQSRNRHLLNWPWNFGNEARTLVAWGIAAEMTKILTIEADITKLVVDVIVNAANEQMLGGGGVDGAIHKAAGPRLLEACRAFPLTNGVRLQTGAVRITPAFNLPSKFIIHTAGPVWQGGENSESELLSDCYKNSLYAAALHGKSVAFPAISTGIFKFPVKLACRIAVDQIYNFLDINEFAIDEIYLVTFKSPEVSECFDKLGISKAEL